MTTLTAGVVGFGERGMTLVKIIHEHVQRMQVIATADPDQKRREIAVNDFHLAPFESAEAMFAGLPHLDVAIVASNPPLHCSHVLLAAKHKCHIFCEKPLALSPTEADKMVVAVRNAGVVCTVDFETIFADSFLILKKELKRDGFGKLYRFIATDKGRPPAYDIETCMPHFLHTMIMLTGSRPIEVYGNVIINEHKATFEDIVHISDLYPQGRSHDIGLRADTMEVSYLFGNGVKANFFLAQLDEDYVVEAGISSKKPGSEFMNFIAYGTRGQVKFHQTATGYVYRKSVPQDTLTAMDWEQVYDPQDPDPAWIIPTARLCNDFVDAIVNQRNPLATIEDAALIVDCTSGIYASHFAGRPLALPLENRRHPLK